MSSNQDHDPLPVKKRRVQRACDLCRRKKRACDGLRKAEKNCTYCIENGLQCTFTGAETSRRSYVDVLEARLELAESLLRKLAPQVGASSQWSAESLMAKHTSTGIPADPSVSGPGVELAALTIRSINTPAPVPHPDDDDLAHIALTQDMNDLSLNHHHEHFHGKSSGAMLVKAAVLAREGYEEKEMPWSSRRMHYWTYNPAKDKAQHVGPFVFPASDLLASLINLYFVHQNIYYPLLHRPTFERSVADALHEYDASFGVVVLLVCAIGARFSNDKRVHPPGAEPLRVGWEFFDQLPLVIDHLFVRPTLHHLQFYCVRSSLATIFLEFSTPAACWTLIGGGIRLAQDVGVHRLQNVGPGAKPTIEGELWKRAFWMLVCMDRNVSSILGRPCTTQYEEFDAELPIEVDDEYWEKEPNPLHDLTQPPEKPSFIAFFNCLIRLNNILGFSLQLLYGLNKAKVQLAHRDDAWEEHIVAELDSALNGWVDLIPKHLRWDPNRQDDVFFDQSALLYCSYYAVQMTIHRPFIPAVRTGAPTSLPSLAICTNAARSVSHIIETSRLRKNGMPAPALIPPAFLAGLMLLLNVWSGNRTGLPPHMNSAIFEVHKCMAAIKMCENRWQSAGLYWDLLYEIASIGNMPLPPAQAQPQAPFDTVNAPAQGPSNNVNKRAWKESTLANGPHAPAAIANTTQAMSNLPTEVIFQSSIAPTPTPDLRTNAVTTGHNPNAAPAPAVRTPSLPTYTADLGRLPLFRQHLQAQGHAGVNVISTSTSGWYPSPTSLAPLDYPAFTPGFDNDSDFATLFGQDALAFAQASEPEIGPRSLDVVEVSDVTAAAASNGANTLSTEETAMWAKAPTGLEIGDWGTYFSVMSELHQGSGVLPTT
ncbi:fungal-specific transcription factor domain-containing protein [Mycena pura]|uniref:Fungal-specific transcription factor domain-containing protein n=1 Tax=Mycena pura TaxID=153505 RepID=A0AAD6Y1V0_9AGAR|nr:fungal-specific transcription factor domain-containing protein [Mycena pura]